MHYTGMIAMRLDAMVLYRPDTDGDEVIASATIRMAD